MNRPQVVSAQEWQAARDALLATEKQHTRALDALAAARRRMPMLRLDSDYQFTAPDGTTVGLADLFQGRRQLVIYHFMLEPGQEFFRTYFTHGRGVNRHRLDFNLLDLTPYGRQEEWEESPEGWPQTPTMQWIRLHDEYDR